MRPGAVNGVASTGVDPGVVLGVDFGTSNTAAVVRLGDGRVRQVLFDGAPLLPSAVCAEPDGDGTLLVGRDAIQAATFHPGGAELHPKQRIDDGSVLLSGVDYPVADLITAVLRRVVTEAARIAGATPARMVLTCPAGWGQHRRETLLGAATAVVPHCDLVVEPLAAAAHFSRVGGAGLAVGACALVYDLGAGTFDVSVVRRTADGWAVLATEGTVGAGGLDLDAAIVAHLTAVYRARAPKVWDTLTSPVTDADRRASRQLWDAVRAAKETLSRRPATRVPLPLVGDDAPLGREQLDALARPLLDQTVAACRAAIHAAGVPAGALGGIYLVGGASRYPLVATLLHQAFGLAPTVVEQPELVVAEGAVDPPLTALAPTRAGSGPVAGGAVRATSRRRRRVVAAAAGLATVAVAVTVVALVDGDRRPSGAGPPVDTLALTSPSSSAVVTAAAFDGLVDPCLIGSWQQTVWESPPVDHYGVDVSLTLRGAGGIRHYATNGTLWFDMSKGVNTRGRAAGHTYDDVHTGYLTWRYRADGSRAVFTRGAAKGRTVVKVDGTVETDRAMGVNSDAETYICTADLLVVNDEGGTVQEFRKLSPTPAPPPK